MFPPDGLRYGSPRDLELQRLDDERCERLQAWVKSFVMSLFALVAVTAANARDLGQWENGDPVVREWYQTLMQPDNPAVSCCGEADAYWADETHFRDGKTFVVITDDRDDAPLRRLHIPNGTEVEIPNHKLKWDRANPTGHGVVFMNPAGAVFCYVQPGGA